MATAKAAPNASEHLQFSGPVYAALLPAYYLVETIKNRNVRPDGRAPEDFRKPVLNVNSLSHSNGSAIVRLGGTTCVCGVSAEIANYDTIPNPPAVDLEGPDDPVNDTETLAALNCVVPNVDLGTGCSPSIIPGQAPTSQAQALAHRLRSLLIRYETSSERIEAIIDRLQL
jgi:exosome complex component RRP43